MGRFYTFLNDPPVSEDQAGAAWFDGDPTLCTFLNPVNFSDGCNGDLSEARCESNIHPEEVMSKMQPNQRLQILNFGNHNTNTKPDYDKTRVCFDGVVWKFIMAWKGNEEHFYVVAYNAGEDYLQRCPIHGQYRRANSLEQSWYTSGDNQDVPPSPTTIDFSTGADLFIIDEPLIFNPNGSPNATSQPYITSDDSKMQPVHLFEAPDRYQKNTKGKVLQAVPWQLSWAVAYLGQFFCATRQLQDQQYPFNPIIDPASFNTDALNIFSNNGDPVISDLNLEGKTLLQAFTELLTPYNYVFRINPLLSENSKTGKPLHMMEFYYRGDHATEKTLRLSTRGTNSLQSESNLIDGEIEVDYTAVVNSVTAYGQETYYTTLCHTNPPTPPTGQAPFPTLVKGWEDADLTFPPPDADGNIPLDGQFAVCYANENLVTTVDINNAPLTPPFHHAVGRLWLVNQGQSPSHTLENLTLDLGNGYIGAPNSSDLRRMEKPALWTTNGAGGLLGQLEPIVEMSTDSGTNWDIIESHWYKIAESELGCGIIFTEQMLDDCGVNIKNANTPVGMNYWQALQGGTLQLRVVCAIKSDQRAWSYTANADTANYDTVIPLARERIIENNGYAKYLYNKGYQSSVIYTGTTPTEAPAPQDDTDQLNTLVEQTLKYTNRVMISGRCAVLIDIDDITTDYYPGQSISGIDNRYSFPSNATIMRVTYDLDAKHAHIVLDNKMVRTPLRGPLDGVQREIRLGKPGAAISGATKEAYIEGDAGSESKYFQGGGQ